MPDQPTEDLCAAFLEAGLRSVSPEVAEWLGIDRVSRTVHSELDHEIGRCPATEFAERYHGIIGAGEPGDYLSRVIEAEGVNALCAIHFCGADTSKPFVNIPAIDGAPASWAGVVERALASFAVFNPRVCKVVAPGGQVPIRETSLRVVGDQVVAAERVGAIAERSAGSTPVSLRNASATDAHPFVMEMYEAHLAANPELVGRVEAASLDQLKACESKGVLAWWCVDGAQAGVIAATPDSGFGIDGWVVMEEVVDRRFGGRGTAAEAQVGLAKRIAKEDPDAVLFGTIDFTNTASRRTAERAGRREIAGWWFVQPADLGSGAALVW